MFKNHVQIMEIYRTKRINMEWLSGMVHSLHISLFRDSLHISLFRDSHIYFKITLGMCIRGGSRILERRGRGELAVYSLQVGVNGGLMTCRKLRPSSVQVCLILFYLFCDKRKSKKGGRTSPMSLLDPRVCTSGMLSILVGHREECHREKTDTVLQHHLRFNI